MIHGTVGPRRRLRVICLAASVLLSATGVLAQGRVTGSVKSEDGQPLKGAMIIGSNALVAPPTRTATSDAKGRFAFMALGKGEWTFTIDAPGYEPRATKLIIRVLGNNPAIDVVLHAAPEQAPTGPLATVDVLALQQRLD